MVVVLVEEIGRVVFAGENFVVKGGVGGRGEVVDGRRTDGGDRGTLKVLVDWVLAGMLRKVVFLSLVDQDKTEGELCAAVVGQELSLAGVKKRDKCRSECPNV